MIDVSIIGINWNGGQILDKFIDNLLELDYQKKEIIIIDNGSTDNSVDILKKRGNIRLFCLPKNIGFAGGNNFGIRKSRGKYILLVNTDVLCPKNLITELLNFIDDSHQQNNQKIGAVYPLILLENGKINTLGSFLYEDFQPFNLGFGKQIEQLNALITEKKTIGFYGACVLLRRDMLDDIGLMNEEYFLYHEETDLAIRGYLNGWRYLLNKDISVVHLHSYSSKPLSFKKIFFSERNRLFNLIKYAAPKQIFFSAYFTFKRFLISSTKKETLHFNGKTDKSEKSFFGFKILKLCAAAICGWIAVFFFLDILIYFRLKNKKTGIQNKLFGYSDF